MKILLILFVLYICIIIIYDIFLFIYNRKYSNLFFNKRINGFDLLKTINKIYKPKTQLITINQYENNKEKYDNIDFIFCNYLENKDFKSLYKVLFNEILILSKEKKISKKFYTLYRLNILLNILLCLLFFLLIGNLIQLFFINYTILIILSIITLILKSYILFNRIKMIDFMIGLCEVFYKFDLDLKNIFYKYIKINSFYDFGLINIIKYIWKG